MDSPVRWHDVSLLASAAVVALTCAVFAVWPAGSRCGSLSSSCVVRTTIRSGEQLRLLLCASALAHLAALCRLIRPVDADPVAVASGIASAVAVVCVGFVFLLRIRHGAGGAAAAVANPLLGSNSFARLPADFAARPGAPLKTYDHLATPRNTAALALALLADRLPTAHEALDEGDAGAGRGGEGQPVRLVSSPLLPRYSSSGSEFTACERPGSHAAARLGSAAHAVAPLAAPASECLGGHAASAEHRDTPLRAALEEEARLLQVARSSLDCMHTLLRCASVAHRLATDTLQLACERVCVASIAQDAASCLRFASPSSAHVRTVVMVDGALPALMGDPQCLSALVTSLLHNALRFTHAGEVRVTVAQGPCAPRNWPASALPAAVRAAAAAAGALEAERALARDLDTVTPPGQRHRAALSPLRFEKRSARVAPVREELESAAEDSSTGPAAAAPSVAAAAIVTAPGTPAALQATTIPIVAAEPAAAPASIVDAFQFMRSPPPASHSSLLPMPLSDGQFRGRTAYRLRTLTPSERQQRSASLHASDSARSSAQWPSSGEESDGAGWGARKVMVDEADDPREYPQGDEATDMGGSDGFRCLPGHAVIELVVADTGCGMSGQQLDSAAQLHSGGLYVARRVAEAYGGRLLLLSTPDRGTCVWCRLMLPLAGGQQSRRSLLSHTQTSEAEATAAELGANATHALNAGPCEMQTTHSRRRSSQGVLPAVHATSSRLSRAPVLAASPSSLPLPLLLRVSMRGTLAQPTLEAGASAAAAPSSSLAQSVMLPATPKWSFMSGHRPLMRAQSWTGN